MAGAKKGGGKKANTGSAKREEARRRRALAVTEGEEADYLEPCPEVESASSGSSKDAHSSNETDPEYDLLEKFASENLGRTLSDNQMMDLFDKPLLELCSMAADCEPGSLAEAQLRSVIHRLYPFEVDMCLRLTGQMATHPRDVLRPPLSTPDLLHKRYASLTGGQSALRDHLSQTADPPASPAPSPDAEEA